MKKENIEDFIDSKYSVFTLRNFLIVFHSISTNLLMRIKQQQIQQKAGSLFQWLPKMLPLDRELYSQRVTEKRNTDYLGNTYDQTTKGTNRTKIGVLCGIKDIRVCIYIHNIMHLYQSHTAQQNQSFISTRLQCSVLGIFYFSPFSATCTKSTCTRIHLGQQ